MPLLSECLPMRIFTYSILLSSLLLSAGVPATAAASSAPAIAPGQSSHPNSSALALGLKQTDDAELLNVTGTLEAGDSLLEDNSLYDVYTFEASAGQSVSILLESTDFDTYLLLVHSSGETVGENDDIGPINTNSSLSGVLPVDGVYAVVVNAHDASGRGDYRLRVTSEGSAAASTSSETIDDLVEQGTRQLRTRQYAAAEYSYQRALQIAQQQGDRPAEAELYEYLAVAQVNSGRVNDGIALFEQALALQRDLEHRPEEMRLLQNLGNTHMHVVGDRAKAKDYYQQALAIAQELGDSAAEQELMNRLRGL